MTPLNPLIHCAHRTLALTKPTIMGILNITPDSFYASSRLATVDGALYAAEAMIKAGADILDIGGESTSNMAPRFGQSQHTTVSPSQGNPCDSATAQQEVERVIPVIEAIAQRLDCLISVDTSAPEVIIEAATSGAHMINDIRALYRPGALEAAAQTSLAIVLTHSLVEHPQSDHCMHYHALVEEVATYLQTALKRCQNAGIASSRLIADPGFGGGIFGKKPEHNLSLIKHCEHFHTLGVPILAGISRKSFIGSVLNCPPDARLFGTLAASMALLDAGVHILRVHDVAATGDVIQMHQAITQAL